MILKRLNCSLYVLSKHTLGSLIPKRHQSTVQYVQGQEPEPKIREYFYYIDHEGMLFLDDAKMKNFTSCFKEKKFLKFFFDRVKFNDTKRYRSEFPYLSPCGRERNFIRCDDTPIVFTHVTENSEGLDKLLYNHAGDVLQIDFEPQKIYMNPETGRVYHPYSLAKVGSIGLIRSKLSIELSKYFEFENGEQQGPTHIWWKDKKLLLQNNWFSSTQRYGVNSNREIQ
ncbi:UPF0598 protein CG30010-like [Musca domestica]|uniref:UPF0598 protein CG30010 n=1 Tax=Musca domestica TaxID=7370 RepID=A0A1I8MRH1_MUSDO|nr:UPF0598 protein CG30010 [Musca domestica]XP_058982118.1 UPF0598 protein CG30010-like [Musca domestica]